MTRFRTLPCLIVFALLFVSCGNGDSETNPATEPPATSAPTLTPGALTVQDLLARVDAAWPEAVAMRSTFWSTEAAAAIPAGTPPATGLVTIEEVRLPSDRRLTTITDGVVTDEQIAVGGRIFMKGALVPAAIAPMVDTQTWVEVDPAGAGSDSPIAPQIAYLLQPLTLPFTTVSSETAGLEAIPGSPVNLDGRSCETYAFGDPAGISYELAIDASGLPCRFVQSAGGFANVTTYVFNDPDLIIAAPEVATPNGD